MVEEGVLSPARVYDRAGEGVGDPPVVHLLAVGLADVLEELLCDIADEGWERCRCPIEFEISIMEVVFGADHIHFEACKYLRDEIGVHIDPRYSTNVHR